MASNLIKRVILKDNTGNILYPEIADASVTMDKLDPFVPNYIMLMNTGYLSKNFKDIMSNLRCPKIEGPQYQIYSNQYNMLGTLDSNNSSVSIILNPGDYTKSIPTTKSRLKIIGSDDQIASLDILDYADILNQFYYNYIYGDDNTNNYMGVEIYQGSFDTDDRGYYLNKETLFKYQLEQPTNIVISWNNTKISNNTHYTFIIIKDSNGCFYGRLESYTIPKDTLTNTYILGDDTITYDKHDANLDKSVPEYMEYTYTLYTKPVGCKVFNIKWSLSSNYSSYFDIISFGNAIKLVYKGSGAIPSGNMLVKCEFHESEDSKLVTQCTKDVTMTFS